MAERTFNVLFLCETLDAMAAEQRLRLIGKEG
jgi:hypothetical protein